MQSWDGPTLPLRATKRIAPVQSRGYYNNATDPRSCGCAGEWTRELDMLTQVDPQTFALNLLLILGAVFVLCGLFVVFVALWTGARIVIHMVRQRRAMREYRAVSRRADGEPYPPHMEGTCRECGRGDRQIYCTAKGDELCTTCYERAWRREKRWPVEADENPQPTTRTAAPLDQPK